MEYHYIAKIELFLSIIKNFLEKITFKVLKSGPNFILITLKLY